MEEVEDAAEKEEKTGRSKEEPDITPFLAKELIATLERGDGPEKDSRDEGLAVDHSLIKIVVSEKEIADCQPEIRNTGKDIGVESFEKDVDDFRQGHLKKILSSLFDNLQDQLII